MAVKPMGSKVRGREGLGLLPLALVREEFAED